MTDQVQSSVSAGVGEATSNPQFELLQAEYLRLCSDIRSIESTNERILTLGAGLVTAVLAYGYAATTASEIIVVVPIAATILLIYASLVYFWVYSMGGYKLHIEDLLNGEAGRPVLLWERLAPERARSNIGQYVLPLLYFSMWLLLVVLSFLKLQQVKYSQTVVDVYCVAFGALVVILVSLGVSASRIGPITYSRAKQMYEGRT